MRTFAIYFGALFCCLNSAFSQSDTVQWGKYLYIKTQLTDPTQYVYEYQDTSGNIIIPKDKYCYLSQPDEFGMINARLGINEDRIPIRDSTEGYIDIHENILIPFIYSEISSFSHNLAWARHNGKIGYIDRKGEVVIDFLYDSYSKFYDDGVVIGKKIMGQFEPYAWDDGRFRFKTISVLIDTLGNEIIGEDHPYQSIEENFPYDHILWVKKDEEYAFFDLKGKPLTPFIFDKMYPANICSYRPGLCYGESLRWFYKGLTVVEKDGQFAVINVKLEYVIPWEKYQWISPMNIGGLMIVKRNNKYGLLNHQLKIVQNIEFDTISNAPYYSQEQDFPSFWAKKNNKYFIFDTLGHWSDSTEYDDIKLLQANYFLVSKNGKSWRMDRNATKIIEDFVVVRNDEGGFVVRKDSLFGLIDIYGDEVLPIEYEDIISEHLGNIFVKKNDKWGVVDNQNVELLPNKYDYIAYAWDKSNNNSHNYIVVQNDKFGKVSTTGDEIFPCLYDGITTWVEYGPKGHYVMKGDKMGLIDYNGMIVIPVQYENVSCKYGTKWAIIYDNGKMGLWDTTVGKMFLPLEYDFIFVDHFWLDADKPVRIVVCKNHIIDILDEKGVVLQSNVLLTEIKDKYNIDIPQYYPLPCSDELLMMKHNKTFQPPICLLEILKEYNESSESIYYNMQE